MAGVGIKGDGNGGLHVKKPTFAAVVAVALALGWPVGDLVMGPAKVREEERLKAKIEQIQKEAEKHEVEANARISAIESRADLRFSAIETRLNEIYNLLVADRRGG